MDSGDQISRSTDRGLEICGPRPRWSPQHRMQIKRTIGTSRKPACCSQHIEINVLGLVWGSQTGATHSMSPPDCSSSLSHSPRIDCSRADPRSSSASSCRAPRLSRLPMVKRVTALPPISISPYPIPPPALTLSRSVPDARSTRETVRTRVPARPSPARASQYPHRGFARTTTPYRLDGWHCSREILERQVDSPQYWSSRWKSCFPSGRLAQGTAVSAYLVSSPSSNVAD